MSLYLVCAVGPGDGPVIGRAAGLPLGSRHGHMHDLHTSSTDALSRTMDVPELVSEPNSSSGAPSDR